ncbi:hypothetical protein HZC07_03140 [Candidatus Micrarchaeota archaeon]|nr:hypothetical protein [Candidatus Micrarchaeota archaeon]
MLSRIVENYLRVIYEIVEKKGYARLDACYIEHQLSEETVTKLVEWIDKIDKTKIS